jgi:ssDNA-binding Zn-finger/Zn-ribbon topoisomerase 1
MIYFILIGIVLMPIIGISIETKSWNNGSCKRCGTMLVQFDTDSQGGRMYKCSGECSVLDSTVTCSWPVEWLSSLLKGEGK